MKWKQLFGFGGPMPNTETSDDATAHPGAAGGLNVAAEEECYAQLLTGLRAGYDDDASLLETATDNLQDACDDASLAECSAAAEGLLQRAKREFATERAAFPARTDNDKLDAGFAALERAGIVARQNFTCCQTCGHAEIGDEFAVLQESVETVRGYVFFHMQDTESAVDGGGLFLAFGAAEGGVDDDIAIAKEACAALRKEGLEPSWDGTHTQRILVPMTWQRRRAFEA